MRYAAFGGALLCLASQACFNERVDVSAREPAPLAERSTPEERVFGAPLTEEGETIEVGQVLENPEPHVGKVVRCSGVVARVCENAGCWLELRPELGDGPGLRVPMAGHAFFIPQEAVGRTALVQGKLSVRPLSDRERAHMESEGLKAIGPLSLIATTVVLR